MPIDNYKPNSKVSKIGVGKEEVKKEKAKVEKVITGVVKSKKKNGFLSNFVSGDVLDLKDYVLQDVLIPAVKDAFEDVVTNGISMMLRGETSRSRKSSASSRVSYRSYYEREDRERDRYRDRDSGRRSKGYSYDDIILETRGEAEDVIARLEEIIDVYEVASVADLYDLVGLSGQHTDNKYGWTDIRNASHVRVRNGYLLKMPRAMPID